MVRGFIADMGYGTITPTLWVSGDPKRGWSGSVKIKKKELFSSLVKQSAAIVIPDQHSMTCSFMLLAWLSLIHLKLYTMIPVIRLDLVDLHLLDKKQTASNLKRHNYIILQM